jgi:hypothetical protein
MCSNRWWRVWLLSLIVLDCAGICTYSYTQTIYPETCIKPGNSLLPTHIIKVTCIYSCYIPRVAALINSYIKLFAYKIVFVESLVRRHIRSHHCWYNGNLHHRHSDGSATREHIWSINEMMAGAEMCHRCRRTGNIHRV